MITLNATPLCLLKLAILTGLFACTHAGPSASNGSRVIREADDDFPFPTPTSRGDIISRHEIDKIGAETAYDVVRQMRPAYLRRLPRGVEPKASVAVFIDNVVGGGPETLSDIPARLIQEIRYVTPTLALERYGGAYGGGIIIVRLRR